MLVHRDGGHTAERVRDGLIKTMFTLPERLRGTLTWDQGAEMSTHKAFSRTQKNSTGYADCSTGVHANCSSGIFQISVCVT